MLTGLYKLQHLSLVHSMQLSHEVHGGQAPVDTAHTKELCAAVFLKNGQLGGHLCEAQNDGMQKLHDS